MNKPGIKTSELWLTAATVLGLLATVPLAGAPLWIAGICAALSTGAYTVSRAYTKVNENATDAETLKVLAAELSELKGALHATK